MHSALLSVSAVLRNLTPIRALPSPVGLVQSPCTTNENNGMTRAKFAEIYTMVMPGRG